MLKIKIEENQIILSFGSNKIKGHKQDSLIELKEARGDYEPTTVHIIFGRGAVPVQYKNNFHRHVQRRIIYLEDSDKSNSASHQRLYCVHGKHLDNTLD